jgi:hypothetical protein
METPPLRYAIPRSSANVVPAQAQGVLQMKIHSAVYLAVSVAIASSAFSCHQVAQPQPGESALQQNQAVIGQYAAALEQLRQKMCPSVPTATPPNLFADACSKAATAVAKPPMANVLAPHARPAVVMADLTLTPGLARSEATREQLCAPDFTTSKFRHTTAAMKHTAYDEYHRTKEAGVCCEVDHLIPLELGGADDVHNLWAEPYTPTPGAHEKDRVENYLREQVCAGNISLPDAQREITTDWFAVYQRMNSEEAR